MSGFAERSETNTTVLPSAEMAGLDSVAMPSVGCSIRAVGLARLGSRGRYQRSLFSVRLENTSVPSFANEGRVSSPEPEVNRWAGPVTCQVREEIGTRHRLTL